MRFLVIMACLCPLAAQDIEIGLNRTNKGFTFNNYTMPDEIIVYDMAREKAPLEVGDLAVIQIWSIDNGGDPYLFSRIEYLHDRYGEQGLDVVGINFENGAELNQQYADLKRFVAERKPKHRMHFDYLGYAVDLLQIPGFPSYILVKDGRVVFTTLGEDEEGVALLEGEIERILEEKSK